MPSRVKKQNASFVLNGYFWRVRFVHPLSPRLRDRTGHQTVATTDPSSHIVCISEQLSGDFLNRVLIHELGHAAMISFGLLDDIHRMVRPECWIEAEEWVCNFIADYGVRIYAAAYDVLGDDAWLCVSYRFANSIA